MRTAYVCALVASLMIYSGCSTTNGPGYGGQSGGFFGGGSGAGGCNQGSASGGCQSDQNFSDTNCGPGGNQGCASGGCQSDQNFSDTNCGPMCGAYLSDEQCSNSGCDCGSCEMAPSYVQGRLNNWMNKGISWPRPFAGVAARSGSIGGCDSGGVGCDSGGGGCDSGGGGWESYGGEVAKPAGPCRGLGAMVGCLGCRECGGGNAVGLNHSNTSGGCDVPGCAGGLCGHTAGSLCGHAKGLLSIPFRPGGSPHPYGGETPHTAAAGAGGGGAAPTYAYPYYTTRGPRDFLMMNPPTIGR